MPENWAAVASEVLAAIEDVGTPVTLRKPGALPANPYSGGSAGAATDYTIYAVPDSERIRDRAGTLTGEIRETLMVGASVAPAKGDKVLVKGVWREVDQVELLWQGGVSILYTLSLIA
jgi:hypothetical protein